MDYTLPPEALLLELINRTNGTTFTLAQLAFGPPIPLTGANDVRNTAVMASPLEASAFMNAVTLRYDRLDFAVLAQDRSTQFERAGALTIADLLPQINARYGVALTASDIVDSALPPAGAEPVEIVLQALQTSLVWQGSATYQLVESAPS
jgi:hypothetical protein